MYISVIKAGHVPYLPHIVTDINLNMYESFFQSFDQKVHLTTEEKTYIASYLTTKTLRKGQYLLQEGDTCKFLCFVIQGAFRQYSTDKAGDIHIFQFAIEGWMVSDMQSFLTGTPSTYNIEAVESAEVLLIDQKAHEALLQLRVYETYIRQQLTGAYLAMQRRLNANLSLTPEERYKQFITNYPEFCNRFPQHMVAAYLGLQPETLSRIRRKSVK